MSEANVCTIIAKNYVAGARVLCDSFLAHHPTGRCYVLVIDEHAGYIDPAEENFTLLTLRDLDLPEPREAFYFKYTVTELATAVKPYLLSYLAEKRAVETVLYLDPDILVTRSLEPLFDRLRSGGGLLLTPHLDTDIPDDGLQPDESHILLSGVFNLGFLGFRATPGTLRVIKWLEGKLRDRCVLDHGRGYFVDQKFFDLAVSLFPEFDIERGVGYNVAYWNLHSRTLSRDAEGRWLCNGEPLGFFHFSNYKPDRPQTISGYLTRFHLKDRPDLVPLFEHYRRELFRHGQEQAQRWPYTFGRFENAGPITPRVRLFYRRLPDYERRFGNPFASKRLRRLSAWRNFLGVGRMWVRRVVGI